MAMPQTKAVPENTVVQPQERITRGFARTALCAVFGLGLIIAGGISAAHAGDDDEEDLLPDQRFFRSILRGLGLRNGQEAGIEYKERPPLVVPPSRNLPPPQPAGLAAQQNPAWPTDPDDKRRASEKKARAERKRYVPEEESRQLSPEELMAHGRTAPGSGGRAAPVELPGPQMSPAELGYKGGMFSDLFGVKKLFGDEPEVAKFTGEPPRGALTDPPAGYRTPSPAQPYGVTGKRDVSKRAVRDHQEEGTQGK
jgi:hypothetical protein